MPNRKARAETARQTVEILDRGEYSLSATEPIVIAQQTKEARSGTVLYTPEILNDVVIRTPSSTDKFATTFCVDNCSTLAMVSRLVESNKSSNTLCLNFASAKNPGGGFLNGSQAQEESLARASGLYACINPVRDFYDANRICGTSLYTHHMIYSPNVPVFRDDRDDLLESPYCVSMITAPAVNAGAVRQYQPSDQDKIHSTMMERIERILAVSLLHQHDTIVLGAWGCGVFRNDPSLVAKWFHTQLLENERFIGKFRHVAFAVLDNSDKRETYLAFAEQFPVGSRT